MDNIENERPIPDLSDPTVAEEWRKLHALAARANVGDQALVLLSKIAYMLNMEDRAQTLISEEFVETISLTNHFLLLYGVKVQ